MPASPYTSKHDGALLEDPLLGFNFKLEVSGKIAGFFTECSGIGSEHDVVEHKVVDDAGHEITRKIPGRLKWGDITLKRGITSDLQIWKWRDDVVAGKMGTSRVNASIFMMDRTYTVVAEWKLVNAWPSKVTGPNLKSDGNEFGVEEVVIVHEGVSREK
jgi:phage tail-like protein